MPGTPLERNTVTNTTTTAATTRPHRARAGAARLAVAALLAGGATVGIAAPAFAHDQLVGTEIVTDSAGAIESVQLSFNNNVIDAGTEIAVTDEAGESVAEGAPAVAGPAVAQDLADDLADGGYDVVWRVVSSDGHPIDGAFAFTVADGAADIVAESAEEEAEHSHEDGESHDHDHDDAEATAPDEAEGDSSNVGTGIAIGVGGLVVVIAAIATITVGQRRRRQAFGDDSDTDSIGRD